MIRQIVFRPEAEREISQAYVWYETRRPGLGADFLLALDATLSDVVRRPAAFPHMGRRTQRALLRRFPYLVLYMEDGSRVVVLGVFDGRRDPESWSPRVCERAS